MLSRSALVALLSVLTVGSTVVLAACSNDDAEESNEPSEDEVRSRALGALGASCGDVKKCKTGLLCKKPSSGPPPGAMGLPIPAGSSSGGPPPGAVGLPIPPDQSGTCSQPGPGENGGSCNASTPCLAGLVCEYGSVSGGGGPPPGAVGLPMPPGSSSGGPPPGAVGLPMPPKDGTCKPESSGPPPGAVGLPMPPQK
jgi:hypothetical protein